MDDTEVGIRRVRSVKDAINLYDDRNHRFADTDSPSLKKTQMDFSGNPTSRTRELHKARRDIGRYKESRWTSESTKAQAESDLSNAKKTTKNLSFMIEESSYKAKSQIRDIETLKKKGKGKHEDMVVKRNENHYEYAKVMRELEYLKKELFQLKLDVASVLEEKSRAENQIEASSSKMIICSRKTEVLRKEIEEANEEQVLAELARIEALKELEDIRVQREREANEFLFKLEITRKKLKEAVEEMDESKELEMKLAMTVSDVDLLQNQLNMVKEMEKRVQGDDGSMKLLEGSFMKDEESGDSNELKTINEELEAAKKELALIRDEGFQFMASMDVIRNELKHVTDETARLKKKDSSVHNLNLKLLRTKSKLEAVSAAEEKARLIVTSLSHALENLKTETDASKKEKEHINQDIITTKEEISKTEFEIDMSEEKLQGVMKELEKAKTSEDLALEKLKTISETTLRERALTAKHSSLITISKFEYEYLTNHAAAAEEIADKKVAAAEAWIEALKASEKEILMETKIAQREFKETMLKEEREIYTKEKMVGRRVSSDEEFDRPRKREKSSSKNSQRAISRKSIKSNGNVTPAKRAKFQKSASPAIATRHVSPFTLKKRKKVIPNLAKLFGGKKITKTKE
ncbi:protein PLASTID MOVEMENT IMPAIRED 15 isoform X2 [Cicer arietinum]|nr:protein PLASTID MOVEMENT IMPAIRED 15 isoform X2 [Cicer arietinum]